MKRLIKILKSNKIISTKKDFVKMFVEEGNYIIEYKYLSMKKFEVIITNKRIEAELEFIKIAMFILS